MNVSSTTATTTSSTQTSTTSKQTENPSVSFDDEMQSAQKQEQELQQKEPVEQQENKTPKNNENKNKTQNITEKNELKNDIIGKNLSSKDLLTLNIQELLDTQNQLSNKPTEFNFYISTTEDLTQNIGQQIEISALEMSEDDAMFFANIVKNNNSGVQNVVQDIQQALEFGTEEIQKSANISKTLLNALQNTVKTGQAVRIDFGNDVAVVMRVNRDGSIMANFIPGDKAVEEYLKNNISILRQRFDEEDIKYSQLSYSQHQQEKRQNQQNKENKHE